MIILKLLRFSFFFFKKPFSSLNSLLETKYWKFNKITLKTFLYFLEILNFFISKIDKILFIIFKKNIYSNSFLKVYFFTKSYFDRYYSCFFTYVKSRKKLLEIKSDFINPEDNENLSFTLRFELNAFNTEKKNFLSKKDLLNYCWKLESKKILDNLRKIFKNKKVLILGPSEINSEINYGNFDIICICNNDPNSIAKKLENRQGFKKEKIILFCNIAYFTRNKQKFRLLNKTIKSILIKPPTLSKLNNFVTPKKIIFNEYGPMGLQNMVYTAFLGQSKEIFVTGMNAYADSKIYRKGVKSYANNLQHYSNNIRRHEPISNFCLIKNFVKMKIVGGDKNFLRVFNLSPEEYAKKLDENLNSLGYKPLLSDYESRFSKFFSL